MNRWRVPRNAGQQGESRAAEMASGDSCFGPQDAVCLRPTYAVDFPGGNECLKTQGRSQYTATKVSEHELQPNEVSPLATGLPKR